MSSKNISLAKTAEALKELNSALSACSQLAGEKLINAEQRNNEQQKQLDTAQKKIEMLTACSQNAVANINELVAKLDKVSGLS